MAGSALPPTKLIATTFSGTVAPDHSGHVIYLQRQNRTGDGFHVAEVGVVGAGSTYSLMYTVYDPGTNVFRVKIPGVPVPAAKRA